MGKLLTVLSTDEDIRAAEPPCCGTEYDMNLQGRNLLTEIDLTTAEFSCLLDLGDLR
jgi:hypothetical protein